MFNRLRSKQTESEDTPDFQQNNRNEIAGSYDESMNVISEGSEIIGTFKSCRNIKVAGKIDGGVEGEGKVIVTSTGFVEGIINCKEAYIAGSVGSDIYASSKVTLASSAVVKSDLYTSNLIVEEGAVFIGFCHMEPEEIPVNRDIPGDSDVDVPDNYGVSEDSDKLPSSNDVGFSNELFELEQKDVESNNEPESKD
jgi:cytoskeletal protein CcmA (bactofilin family)